MPPLNASDLVRVAELITLGAETAKLFSDTIANGKRSRITEVADRIEAASRELAEIGREMEGNAAEAE